MNKILVLLILLALNGCATTDNVSAQQWHNLNTDMQIMDMRLQEFNKPR